MRIFKQIIVFLVVSVVLAMPCISEDLKQAIRSGDAAKVKALLEKNPGLVNDKDADGRTPLHHALFNGNKEIIDLLVARGADVNAASKRELTPLLIAAYLGHTHAVKLLISKGARVNKIGFNHMTPLLFAVSRGHKEIVELLIAKGASLKVTDKIGSNALLLAVMSGHKAVVEALIAGGVDLDAANSRGSTPLTAAAREGRQDIVDLLLAKGAANTLKKIPALKGEYLGQTKPGLTPLIFAIGFVSTEYRQLNAVFTPDMKEFYFAVQKPNAPLSIMVTKQVNNQWTTPAAVSFSGKYSDVDHSISPDGRTLFFSSGRPLKKGEKPKRDHDFWMTKRSAGEWTEPQHLGLEVNSEREDYYPVVTKNGTLYFSSQREGEGTNNIYRSQLQDGKYGKGEKLGDTVNSSSRDFDPFIAPDENFIIFASERPGGFGASDLYISFRKKDGTWTKAKNMGEKINSSSSDYTPMLSPDGKYLFFTSGRSGVDDIYWIDAKIIEHVLEKGSR